MLHTPWKELIFLATFLKFTCYVYTIRVAPMFCWSPMKKNPTYQSLHSVRSSLWVISSLLLNMRFARFPFCFLLGAAIVFCTYCYVKPLRYLIIRKTSNSIKTLRTHRILKLQNRNKTWNLSCNNIPKIIQLTHTLFHSLVTSKSNRTDFPHSNSTVFCFQSLWRFGRKDFEGTSWTQIIPYNYEYWLQNWMSFSIL